MAVELNHTIVWCRDKLKSSTFLTEMLGLPPAAPFGPMLVVKLSNGVSLDYYENAEHAALQHYAFLVSEGEFDQVYARVQERAMAHWADPAKAQLNQVYRLHGGRGVYFDDPDGHLLEVMTRPYPV